MFVTRDSEEGSDGPAQGHTVGQVQSSASHPSLQSVTCPLPPITLCLLAVAQSRVGLLLCAQGALTCPWPSLSDSRLRPWVMYPAEVWAAQAWLTPALGLSLLKSQD